MLAEGLILNGLFQMFGYSQNSSLGYCPAISVPPEWYIQEHRSRQGKRCQGMKNYTANLWENGTERFELGFSVPLLFSLSETLQNSTSSTGHMPQKTPRECLAWLAGRHGLCSLVHATHFCVKLELSPHGQLVKSCRALWELQPQHPFIPSTSLCIMCIDSPRRTRLEIMTPTLD